MIKRSIHEEFITIINIYARNSTAPKYVKQRLMQLRGGIDKSTIMETSIPHSILDRTTRQEISKEVKVLHNTIHKAHLTDAYRTPSPTTTGYTFF